MPGEWLSQGGIFPGGKIIGLGRKLPNSLNSAKLGPINLRGSGCNPRFPDDGLFQRGYTHHAVLTGWGVDGPSSFSRCAEPRV